MVETAGAGGAAPWFFLSHAHHRGSPSADVWVARFHADLTRALARSTGGTEQEVYGFLDPAGDGDGRERERRGAALARCRAFVALCSPDYFADLECHREWTAFHRRPAPGGSARAAVVPVLWERLWTDRPGGVELDRPALARRFGEDGLRAAATKPRLREEYAQAVRWVADAVRAAAEQVDLLPGDPAAVDGPPSPWPGHPVERTLRILVLACRRGDDLPPGCDRGRYGDLPQDWRPYGDAAAPPVAELAARLALARNWHVTAVEDFEKAAVDGPLPGAAEGPQLLLLDRWALRSARLRELLLSYNRPRRHPLAVMVPWDPQAPGALAHEAESQERTLGTLDRALGRPKPDFEQLRRGIPDPACFADLLPRALEQARQAFFARRR